MTGTRTMQHCSEIACEKLVHAKGLCLKHYTRVRRHGDPAVVRPGMGGICPYSECERNVRLHGWCELHWRRIQTKGSPDPYPPPRNTQPCDTDGCDRLAETRGLCDWHYQREPDRREASRQWASSITPDERRRRFLKRRYKMSPQDFDLRLAHQGGVCAVCETNEPPEGWHIHHDHQCCPGIVTCGACVVAILCARCNRAMGAFEDNADLLGRAADLARLHGHGGAT